MVNFWAECQHCYREQAVSTSARLAGNATAITIIAGRQGVHGAHAPVLLGLLFDVHVGHSVQEDSVQEGGTMGLLQPPQSARLNASKLALARFRTARARQRASESCPAGRFA
jgi:hypothetical protein